MDLFRFLLFRVLVEVAPSSFIGANVMVGDDGVGVGVGVSFGVVVGFSVGVGVGV